jgi:GT2 family glycosyltransferase
LPGPIIWLWEQLIKAQAIYQHVYMLNNDTVIEPQTISILLKKMRQDNIRVANSLILDYFDRSKIQFAGGKLYPWGKAKFFFKTNNTHSRFSEFTHGCALMIELEVLRQFGLLSNLFFHGEEDFDFSWRLKENSEPVKCYFESKVYHKEGNSVVKYTKNKESKLILSALNRFKNMQLKYSSFVWTVWLIPSSLHYIRLLHRGAGTSLWRSILIVKLVISYTRVHDSIEKTAVPTIISGTH